MLLPRANNLLARLKTKKSLFVAALLCLVLAGTRQVGFIHFASTRCGQILRLRWLSGRAAKDALLLIDHPSPELNADLNDSLRQFQATFEELKQSPLVGLPMMLPERHFRDGLSAVEGHWKRFALYCRVQPTAHLAADWRALNREADHLNDACGLLVEIERQRLDRAYLALFVILAGFGAVSLCALPLPSAEEFRQQLLALRRIEADRDRLFMLSPNLICVAGFDHRFRRVNPGVVRALGFSEEELLGFNYVDLIHPDDRDATLAAIERQARGEKVERFECRVRTRRDGYRWISWTAAPEVSEGVFYAIGHDFTELKQSEAALLKKQAELRAMYEASPFAMFVADPHGVCLEGNRECELLAGMDSSDAQGMGWARGLHPEDRQRAVDDWNNILIHNRSSHAIYRFVHPNGQVVWASVNMAPIRNGDELLGYVGVMQDITRSKYAEDALRDQAALNRAVLETAPDAIITVDEAGVIDSANPAAAQIFGYEAQELPGRGLELLVPDPLQMLPDEPRSELQVGESRTVRVACETSGVRKSGESFPLEISLSELRVDAGLRYTCILRDITERKRNEHELRQSMRRVEQIRKNLELQALELEQKTRLLAAAQQKAEQASRAKSEFLANMSHEIRTPMTAILGFADVLMENLSAPQDIEAVNTIRRNGKHLLEIINEILDLSKIEAGKLHVERIVCSPIRIVDEVTALMRVRADAKGLDLGVEYQGPIPRHIYSDPMRLRQILVNLLGNAVKFTERGSVRLVVRLAQEDEGRTRLAFDVIDTGIGMSTDRLAKLFRPFTQSDAATTRRYGGTGLGLTISKRLASLLGGKILVQSEPGQGSTFTLLIDPGPLTNVEMAALATDSDSRLMAATKPTLAPHARVLLAEDGPDNQRLISYLLRKAGAEVEIVDNGQAAVDAALAAQQAGQPFGLILMDMQMPLLDGYDATRQLRAAGYPGPIVALTAHAMSGDRNRCLEAGCDDYATKPIHRDQLLRLVAEYVKTSATEQATGGGATAPATPAVSPGISDAPTANPSSG